MHMFRTITSGLLSALLQITLFVFPAVLLIALLFRSPAPVQTVLQSSGAYDQFVPKILEQNAQTAEQQGNTTIATLLRDSTIQQSAREAFSAGDAASLTNRTLDGLYAWLQGKTTTPTVQIDLQSEKAAIERSLNTYVLNRVSTVPTCTFQQLRTLQATELNPLNTPCLPPGISAQGLADQFSSNALANTDLSDSQSINVLELKDSNGKALFMDATWLPDAYQWLMRAPLIMAIGALLLGISAILAHPLRYRGLRNVSLATLIAGIFWLISSVLYSTVLRATLSVAGGEIGEGLSKGIQAALGQYTYVLIIVTVVYLILGIGGLLVARRFQKQQVPLRDQKVVNIR